jgi:EAL domain-containing protein (putative c-di-GMP-specific phosphodiesterase class I)/DNA-binding NarL/FixJ family response regulator
MPSSEPNASAITVLIADDDASLRRTLERMLTREEGIVVVGTAGDAEGAIAAAAETRPQVALVDVHMPGGGEAAVRGILAASPETHVVVLSGSTDAGSTQAVLGAGAGSYIVKGGSPEDVIAAVTRAARGESILAAEVASSVMGELVHHLEQTRAESLENDRVVERIRGAIDEAQLVPVFQPVIELEGGRVVAYEALSRFPAEPGVPPVRWFADAERVGLREELELAAAAAAFTAFESSTGNEALSVNASPDVVARVAERGLWLGSRMIVEVTEHAVIKDYQAVAEGISRYRAAGVRLAVDDAGAGFASFRHVLELEPDFIKLDATLVRSIDTDRGRRALAGGLIGFAKELGIATVAEGVESPAELETLRSLGADLAQGFLIGMPGRLPVTQ